MPPNEEHRIIYSSTERTPIMLPELAGLLPPLSEEQLGALETDLLKNGCYTSIISMKIWSSLTGITENPCATSTACPIKCLYSPLTICWSQAVGAGYPEGPPQPGQVGVGQDRPETQA